MHTAKQIWDDLAVRYSQNNVPRLFNQRKDLASLIQGTKSITAYFTQYRGLMDELENLSPIPKCVCVNSNCACQLSAKLNQYEQRIKLSQFLMGLNDQFTTTRCHILLMQPLPDLSHAYSMLLQEENQRDSASHSTTFTSEHVAINVNFTKSKGSSTRKDDKRKDKGGDPPVRPQYGFVVCEHCKYTGHTKDTCFVIHGYPEWHKNYGQPKPKLRVRIPQANSASACTEDNKSSDASCSTDSLSDSQCQQLIQMLQSKLKPSAACAPWISTSSNSATGIHSAVFASSVQLSNSENM